MPEPKLSCCTDCGQFVKASSTSCSFCGAAMAPRRRLSTAAKWGVAAAVSMLSVGAVMGCAYGGPPADCTTVGCGTNFVCDTKIRTCVPSGTENTNTENVTTDGGTSD
ncbi:MAG: hypothetical protein EP343_33730 [Deltaproteobacteria bacterium]|nr:MAG: hypothetical protein EP343_33730 [Deltaproteobacteria bacterium]